MSNLAAMHRDDTRDQLRRRSATARPVWEDAHSPLDSREFLTAPRSGTIRRVRAGVIASALPAGHPLREPLGASERDVMAYVLCVPERHVTQIAPVDGSFACLPDDPVEVQALINDEQITVTIAAHHISTRRHSLDEPVRIPDLRLIKAKSL